MIRPVFLLALLGAVTYSFTLDAVLELDVLGDIDHVAVGSVDGIWRLYFATSLAIFGPAIVARSSVPLAPRIFSSHELMLYLTSKT